MAASDMNPEPDNGPDTTPGIPPSRPAPLQALPVPDAVSRPPDRDGLSGLSLGLGAAVAVLGLYVLFNWPWSRPPRPPDASPVAAAAPAAATPAPAAPSAAAPVPQAAPQPMPSADTATAVHRCEKPGEVIFTDGPCPGGMRGAPVNTSPAPGAEGGQTSTLYRCKGAGRFWSVVHCQHRGAEVVGTHAVPADLPLAEQILFAQNRETMARPARPARPPAVAPGPPATLTAASMKALECRRLDEGVAVLVAYARQPLSGGEQDRVARQRRDLRDEQFRLRCGR